MSTAKEIVGKWHDALNQGDLDTLMALVAEDVDVSGPHGTTHGAAIVREWFGRANVRLIPLAYYTREQRIVVEEEGEWIDPISGVVTGSQRVATYFVVAQGMITHILRHDQLEVALAEANLTLSDREK